MKKALLIVALMLLCASTAMAEAKFSMTGSYWAEGKYWFNYNAAPDTKANYNDTSFGFYEQDINLFPKITVDNTSLNFRVAITDTSWGVYDGSEAITQSVPYSATADNNIQIERAYMTHKFNDMFTLDVGLMDGTQWGTTFGDDKQAQWRVKGTATTAAGVFLAVLEKNKEFGKDGKNALNENKDVDSYGLAWVGKVGNIYLKQLLWFADARNASGSNAGYTVFNPVLAINGDLGAFSFESEINYKLWHQKYEAINYDQRFGTLGLYLNLWKALGNMTPGISLAYGSFDKDAYNAATALGAAGATYAYQSAFDFEDDFNSSVILGDEYCWGGAGDDLQGMTMVKLYVNDIKTGVKPLTLFASAEYVMSNQKDSDYEDATAWEIDLGTNYKITDNLTYSVYGAYADISYDVTGIDDPDSVYMVANSIEFDF